MTTENDVSQKRPNSDTTKVKRKPGRPKGSKTKHQKLARRKKLAFDSVGQTDICVADIAGPDGAPLRAPDGIDPLSLMLATMRMYWRRAHAKGREAQELEEQAEQSKAAGEADSVYAGLMERAQDARVQSGKLTALACTAAEKAAPYCHSKMQTIDGTAASGIVVEIRDYKTEEPKLPAPIDGQVVEVKLPSLEAV